MPKYLIEGRYNADGAKGVAREGGSSRRDAVVKLLETLGGKLESMYFAFGDVDTYILCEMPDEASAVAASLAANQSGALSVRLVPLIDPRTVDEAAKKGAGFRGPGQ